MTDSHQPEDIAANNESSLKALVRAIRLSQGQFRLILARCNYGALRDRMVQRLRELSPVKIREIVLPESVKTLYTTIKAALGDEVPQALMVSGLELVSDIKAVLTSSNTIREEFSKNFPFPLVFWIDDEVLKKLLRIAPDLESWATSVEFKLTTDELRDFLRQKTDKIFSGDSTPKLANCFEVEAACKELPSRGQALYPDLEARLEFVRGLDDFRYDRIDQALAHYRKSLALPNLGLERQGILLLNIARCYYRKAELNRAKSQQCWEESRNYFQQGLDAFEQAQRPDLLAKHISQLGEVLRRLKAWDELKSLAEKAMSLHQTHGEARQLAQDYGFLAEVALEQSGWKQANQLTQQALQLLSTIPNRKPNDLALCTFLLARSQAQLGQIEEALTNLEQVRQNFNPQYDPQLYIDSLGELRSLYFGQGEYREAFQIKQEQFQIEHQYGFRAFIGAGYLQPKRSSVNPAVGEVEQQGTIAQEIAVSSREQDVKRLIERMSRNDCKLTVIHGQSGVGKSSILQGGLVPALHQQAIGERDVLPVLLRVYKDWVGALEMVFANAEFSPPSPPTLGGTGVQSPPELGDLGDEEGQGRIDSALHSPGLPPQPPLLRGEQDSDSPLLVGEGLGERSILQQLRNNAENNLLTVLIFDQFEEFFFVYSDQAKRRQFYEFLRDCLDIPFVKVILSLREDYLHYLLELDRLFDLTVINNNILDKGIRYYLGNFSLEDARSVVQSLTRNSQFPLETGLIEAFVQDLAGEVAEVRPIELQIVGMQLQTEKITTLQQYQQGWTKNKLVEGFLEDVIHDCGADNERAARLVLYLLTNENGTRPLKTHAEVEADLKVLGFESETEQLDLVLEILSGSGLVFLVPDSPANRYQLVHDYLVVFIRQQQAPGLLAELAEAREKQKLTEAKLRQALREKEEALRLEQQERKRAEIAEIEALNLLSQALLLSHDQLGALLASVKAGKKLQKSKLPSELNTRTVGRLWQAVYSVQERNRFQGHSSAVKSISFSPDGQTLASGSDNGIVKLWCKDGTEVQTFDGHNGEVWSVAWSPDGQILASASLDSTVKLWHLDGTEVQTFRGHSSWVIGVNFSPDGQMLASASRDRTVKLWHLDGTEVRTFQGHSGWVTGVSFSPDGQMLASASRDRTVKLWRLDGTEIQTFHGHSGEVWSVAWSPDGQMLVSASHDCTVKLWRLDGTIVQTFTGHSDRVISVAWSLNGQIIASASLDHTVKLWRLDGTLIRTFQGHSSSVYSVSFSPDGQMLASASRDRTVKLWCLHETAMQIFQGHRGWVNSICFSPDGQTLASASRDCTVKLWYKDGRLVQTFQGHRGWVNSISFSPDGQMIASGSRDRTVKLWCLDGILVRTFQGHSSSVYSVAWSPDGQMIASGSRDRTVKLWCKDGTEVQTFHGHNSWVNSISFSADGQMIASASVDHTVKLWRLDGTEVQTFHGHSAGVRSVRFSPDCQMIASASDDRTVILRNLALKELLILGCNWLRDYLKTNPNVSESDRHLCDGIGTQK